MTTKSASKKADTHHHAPAHHEPAHGNPKTDSHEGGTPSNAVKDPHDWTTGGETMTGAQASYLKTLCEEAGEEFDPGLTKSEASLRIDELRNKTGRGKDH